MDPSSFLHAHRKIILDTLHNLNRTAPPQTQTPTSSPTPPPPAYTPTAPLPHTHPFPLPLPIPTSTHNTTDIDIDIDDDDDLPPPPPPPITIRIDGTTKIVGHGNVLACAPAETATRLAAVLVAALRQARVLEGGAARPVEVSVGAGVSVVGCRNVVGATTGVRGKGMEKGVDQEGEGKEEGGGGAGRKRVAEEDLVEMPRAKKVEM